MKTVSRLLPAFLALAVTTTVSMGMGYPQDMFAEHVTVKHTGGIQPRRVGKEGTPGRKAAGSQSARKVGTRRAMPDESNCLPKGDRGCRQAETKTAPLVGVPACRKVCIIAVGTFNRDGNDPEERVFPLEGFSGKGRMGWLPEWPADPSRQCRLCLLQRG